MNIVARFIWLKCCILFRQCFTPATTGGSEPNDPRMMIRHKFPVLVFFMTLLSVISCNRPDKALAEKPEKENVSAAEYIRENIHFYLQNSDKPGARDLRIPDLHMKEAVDYFYSQRDYKPVWVDTGRWTKPALSFMGYLDTAAYDGLYPEDYHYPVLKELKAKTDRDSLSRADGNIWTKAELLMTNAFMQVIMDLKQGRIMADSVSWRHDSARHRTFFASTLDQAMTDGRWNELFRSLQPRWPMYDSIRQGIPAFLSSMDTGRYTYLNFPFNRGDSLDSIAFISQLQVRLIQAGISGIGGKKLPDSVHLSHAIRDYQKKAGIEADGKIGPVLVRTLNTTDRIRRAYLAISLDKIKQLPDSPPHRFIWVNLPSFGLQFWNEDTVAFESKIICGKPVTPTPILTSAISDMVIFPTWTVPESIIKKEMLPGLKKNPGYLARKGLSLYNYKGEMIDPATINWSKYSKGIPYKIQQGSGEDNALGVIKFNFDNPYFVYLHDTNQRYLFKNKSRALSHGCVRVQRWDSLATWIIRNDSLNLKTGDSLRYNFDTLSNWIAMKEKHRVPVKNRLPLYIRYLTCAGKSGQVIFYDDIYLEDKKLKETYFKDK